MCAWLFFSSDFLYFLIFFFFEVGLLINEKLFCLRRLTKAKNMIRYSKDPFTFYVLLMPRQNEKEEFILLSRQKTCFDNESSSMFHKRYESKSFVPLEIFAINSLKINSMKFVYIKFRNLKIYLYFFVVSVQYRLRVNI